MSERMNFSLCRWAILFVWLTPSLTVDIYSRKSQLPTTLESPRLAALMQEINAGRQGALERFWREMKGKTPLVELISGDDSSRLVTFLFPGGDEMRGIALIGPVPPEMRHKQLSHLAGADLWFLTVRLPKAARFSLFDGWDYRRRIPLPTILDNLIASRKIIPLAAILIHNESQTTRNRELGCDEQFTDFLAKELVPWARKNYRISADPMHTIVAGGTTILTGAALWLTA
jgi:hypothetical protein